MLRWSGTSVFTFLSAEISVLSSHFSSILSVPELWQKM